MIFECTECHAPVKIDDAKTIVRSCNCPETTGVVAQCSATVYGESRVASDAPRA